MKRQYLWISFAALAVFLFLLSGDALAKAAWQRYRAPTIALALDRSDAPLAMQIGNYYFGGGAYELDIAEKAYRKAVGIDPKILWGHYQLARIIFVRGDFDNAIVEINAELAANPANLRSLYVRGLIYGYRGNLEKAEDDFRRFTEWAPSEWAGYNDLAWILEKRAKYADAKAAIEQAFRVVPDAAKNPWLWNSLGVAELNLGGRARAHEAFQHAQTLARVLSPDDWRASYPGNAPSDAANGLEAFKNAVAENLNRSKPR